MLESSENKYSSLSDGVGKKSRERLKFVFYSSVFLERWHPDTPFVEGIGGSETSHIELVKLLSAWGHEVWSYIPLPPGYEETEYLKNFENFDISNHQDSIIVVYRDPAFFDKKLDPSNLYWFVSQDCDGPWTEERLKYVDRFIVLCPVHGAYVANKYPSVEKKITYSSNGIRSDFIKHIKTQIKNQKIPRDLKRVIYTSSPDRGLLLILQNWFRILEQVPDANFHFFYGFNNADKISGNDPNHHLTRLREDINRLSNQPGVTNHGRVPQDRLYYQMAQASIWFYPTDWPETSCISCMEAQAFGVVPVVSDFWALRQNIMHGYKFQGIPQTSPITKIRMIDRVIDLLKNPPSENFRKEMAKDALETFNWSVFGKQFVNLGHIDMEKMYVS